jgi:hypothetical protein
MSESDNKKKGVIFQGNKDIPINEGMSVFYVKPLDEIVVLTSVTRKGPNTYMTFSVRPYMTATRLDKYKFARDFEFIGTV